MDIGISNFPTDYSISAVDLGRELESRGFESLWVVEHTHIPASRETPYPMGGELPAIYWEAYEPFTYLAQAAAVTDRLQVGTGVCLVAQHHPIALAKRCASLDSLSNGRLLLGVGGGWLPEEMRNHGFDFKDRWAILREHVLAMKQCWTQKDAEFHGRFVDFDPVWVQPKPKRAGGPPVLIGATSTWAMQRIAEYADGWYPVMTPGFDAQLAQLRQACEERGRDVSELDITVLTQPADRTALEVLRDKGVNRVVLSLPTLARDEALRVLDSYAPIVAWAASV
ncbi:MAG: TIGR03619 family F420-dependent LLM class oxidoreductase [Pseudomonadales bacterium]|nr:TIGR03619 family F420-dependent LLM class oxidoreductase [Pseudomonadales bacterium]MCP5183366.1 TIGR03619 family F420-dependent LLM class oxidoreductase [Pseudomonadales bacterium]